ncbi:type IV secretory system conjugative DNA transfer family protein [Hyphomicrobium sp.]|uniref:type IV secretory system conjugative DNA transfer family protein n=1 Tax=Hyphomicrobium sp. TaxID=82 RepID=UPI002FE2F5B9
MAEERGPSKPILKPALLLGGLLYLAYGTAWLDNLPADWQALARPLLLAASVLLAGSLVLGLLSALPELLRRIKMATPTIVRGSARWGDVSDARKAGLHNRGWFPIGAHEGRYASFENETHTLIVAATGAGKSVNFAIPTLMRVRHSMIVTDTKKELVAQTARYRQKRLKHQIVVLDGTSPAAYNVCQLVLDDLALSPQDAVADARAIALQILRDPPQKDQNQYFRQGARLIIETCILGLGVRSPAECNLVKSQRLVTDVPLLLAFLEDLRNQQALCGDIAAMAESLLATHQDTPREFQSFVNGAVQALAPYAASGRLARISEHCSFRFADLKRQKMTIYVCCDMTRMKAYAEWIALINWAAMVELQRCGNAVPVVALFDEATNFQIDNLPNLLTLLRAYGVRVIVIVQELEDLSRVYGKAGQSVILAQCRVKIFFGAISAETAARLVPVLGSETKQDFSFGMGNTGGVSENANAVARPLKTQSELQMLPEGQQIVLIGGHPPFLCRTVGWHETWPERRYVDDNPLHGAKRFRAQLKLLLQPWPIVLGAARESLLPKPPSIVWNVAKVYLMRALTPATRLGVASVLLYGLFSESSPHLRVSYRSYGTFDAPVYVSCDYLGWHSHHRMGPDCPLILWRAHD